MIGTSKQSGFTLVEMIVSLALFATVVTIAVGALLVLIASNERLQNEQSVMTNLSFALDSMTREIRTGTYYYCDSNNNQSGNGNIFNFENGNSTQQNYHDTLGELTRDCPDGRNRNASGVPVGQGRIHGISFIESGESVTGGGSQRILYYHEHDTGQIFRRIGNGDPQPIVSSGIYITDADFYVTGTDPQEGSGDVIQPMVTITIEARAVDDASEKTYQIQTTVTQRALDI